MARTVRIAAINFMLQNAGSLGDFRSHCRRLLDEARDAELVVFPELLTFEILAAPDASQDAAALAAMVTDEYRSLFAAEAVKRGAFIAAGSHLMHDEHARPANVAHLFAPDGTVHQQVQRSPDAPPPQGQNGTQAVVALPFAKIAFNIGHEVEDPSFAAEASRLGAELIVALSLPATEAAFWRARHCAHARAIENQVYVVHACTGGPNAWARTSILGPSDEPWPPNGVIAESEANAEGIASATLDIDALYERRAESAAPTFRDRRRRAEVHARWRSAGLGRAP